MGLDITAYRQVRLAPAAALNEHGDIVDDDHFRRVYKNPDFPDRADDLVDGAVYTNGVEAMDFCAGGYIGYGRWRDQLARLAGYEDGVRDAWDANEGPFWELINFADNEGVIGAVVSAKLAKDFADFQTKADEHPDEYFREKYAEWREAFDMASDGGYVNFH